MKPINTDGTDRIDVDKAWDRLYTRLEKEQLVPVETGNSSYTERKISLRWIAIAASICIGLIISVFYLPRNRENAVLSLQNEEDSGTLVATFNDGSTVYLAANTSISYPAAFDSHQRKVELNGNALFCVTKDEKRPFVVETNENITIEVVGTIFAVQSSPGNSFELFVKQGKVNVYSKDNPTKIPVEAGETVQLNAGGLNKFTVSGRQIFNQFTDKLCFKDEKLSHIVQAINTLYGSPTIIADQSLNNRTLTVTFENNSLTTMAEIICLALNLEQINKQDTLFIRPVLK